MSADIFISYRHGGSDSWAAGRLNDLLGDHFDVYFDTDREANDLGDDFARGIDAAIAGCRIVFVVIGPTWIQRLPELGNAKDWVRYELAAALARDAPETPDRFRIVPLFVDAATAPDWSTLPVELQPLGNKNGRPLHPNTWDSDSAELIQRVGKWLTTPRSLSAPPARMPPVLPFLCDRQPQEDRLVEIIEQHGRAAPIACVVHGYRQEAHAGFFERVRYQRVFEDVLGAAEVGVAHAMLPVNRDRWRDGRYRESLMSAIKAGLLNRRTAPEADVRAHFSRLAKPLVLEIQVTWSDVATVGNDLIARLIDAWHTLLQPEPGIDAAPLPYPALLWINLTYDDTTTNLSDAALVLPLPKLPPVDAADIATWLGRDDVKAHIGDRQYRIEDLAQQRQYHVEPGKLHMRVFADRVRDILSAP